MLAPTHEQQAAETYRVALAGNPNVGKTTIFNALTGLHQHVGNWPGKTVERKEGWCQAEGRRYQVVDLPGAYSLTSQSAEEVIARDYILQQRPEVVVVVADASAIERNLYLLAQVLELTDRVVLALNMMDLAAAKGYRLYPDKLAAALGVPVVELVARRGQGWGELLAAIAQVAEGKASRQPRPIDYLAAEPALAELQELLPGRVAGYPSRWVALKLLEGDSLVSELAAAALDADTHRRLLALLRRHEHEPAVLADARYAWIEHALAQGMARPARQVITVTDRIDHLAIHRLLGLPLLLAVFTLMFWLTFTTAAPITAWLDGATARLAAWVGAALVGPAPGLGRLLAGGVIPGVGGVIAFLPVLVIFFLFLGALEESGYLARAAFVTDSLMHALGLHGKAFLGLLVGYGCNVPGVMAARLLENERDRVLAMLVNPLIPCAARMGVAAFLVGALLPRPLQTPVMASLYLLSLAMVLLAGFLLRRVVLPGEQAPLMMELPLYRLPSLRSLGRYAWWRVLAFLRKVGTVILAAAVLVWFLASYPAGLPPAHTYLGRLGVWLSPVGGLLGLDWRMSVALLAGFAAKETSLATLGVLYHAQGQGLAQALQAQVTPLVGLVFVVVQLLYVPCLATVAAIRSETGSWRWTALAVAYPLVLTGLLGALIYWTGRALGLA